MVLELNFDDRHRAKRVGGERRGEGYEDEEGEDWGLGASAPFLYRKKVYKKLGLNFNQATSYLRSAIIIIFLSLLKF